jgi:hypothetical protein
LHTTSLGELKVEKKSFKQVEQKLEELNHSKWILLNEYQKQFQLSFLLLTFIREESEMFVLREVADFIDRVHQKNLCYQYSIYTFETFLNHYLDVSDIENGKIRSKISGKQIPRSEYQTLFPIGMDKYYEGPHFVTAHSSPDLDTLVASFWGWLDAFSARISLGCHVWNVPGGPPKGVVEKKILFEDVFGDQFFQGFSKDKTMLSITAYDLFTKKGLKFINQEALLTEVENEEGSLVITQDDGVYLADWKGFDSENYRRITSAIFSILRAFEGVFQHGLIQAFSKKTLQKEEVKKGVLNHLQAPICKTESFLELPIKLQHQVVLFFEHVLDLKEKEETTFETFFKAVFNLDGGKNSSRLALFAQLYEGNLYEDNGKLKEDRQNILTQIDQAVALLKNLMETVRKVFAFFKLAIRAKEKIFASADESVSSLSDIEEIRSKIGYHPYLTVSLHHQSKEKLPLGVIYSNELQKPILGTVTCRDFTNKEETKIPSYLEVISGLDHHKMAMSSQSPMTLKLMDVQSANTLLALEAFKINDRFSFGGMDAEKIDQLINEEMKKTDSSLSILQKLFQRKMNIQKYKSSLIHPQREILEYLHFIFAILDDTDLLSKVTMIDVECMASLVNRLRSLQLKKEVEVVHFDDLNREDPSFPKIAAKKLLQNDQLYSLYKTIYEKREKAVEDHIEIILKAPTFPLFEDTKVQNGCARVGQKKLYSSNIKGFQNQKTKVLDLWIKESQSVFEKNPLIDLHLLMISTIASCQDVFQGSKVSYSHQDELWFYVPDTEMARSHLKLFLNQFKRNKVIEKKASSLKVITFGETKEDLKCCFEESFLPCKIEMEKGKNGFAVLYHEAGILNSRKSMISPFLPVVI